MSVSLVAMASVSKCHSLALNLMSDLKSAYSILLKSKPSEKESTKCLPMHVLTLEEYNSWDFNKPASSLGMETHEDEPDEYMLANETTAKDAVVQEIPPALDFFGSLSAVKNPIKNSEKKRIKKKSLQAKAKKDFLDDLFDGL
jgi:hypothetical protein